MAEAYRMAFAGKAEIDGPELLSWARRKYLTNDAVTSAETAQVLSVLQRLVGKEPADRVHLKRKEI